MADASMICNARVRLNFVVAAVCVLESVLANASCLSCVLKTYGAGPMAFEDVAW